MAFTNFHDGKDFTYIHVIRIRRRYPLVHPIPGSVKIYLTVVRRCRPALMKIYQTSFKRKLLYTC